jgi:hypothetical protein
MILPEHDTAQTQTVITTLRQHLAQEVYFPPNAPQGLGKPIREWGQVHAGVVSLNGAPATGKSLLRERTLRWSQTMFELNLIDPKKNSNNDSTPPFSPIDSNHH